MQKNPLDQKLYLLILVIYTQYTWIEDADLEKLNHQAHLAMVARAHSFSIFSQSQHIVKLFNIQLKSFECLLEEFSPIHSLP